MGKGQETLFKGRKLLLALQAAGLLSFGAAGLLLLTAPAGADISAKGYLHGVAGQVANIREFETQALPLQVSTTIIGSNSSIFLPSVEGRYLYNFDGTNNFQIIDTKNNNQIGGIDASVFKSLNSSFSTFPDLVNFERSNNGEFIYLSSLTSGEDKKNIPLKIDVRNPTVPTVSLLGNLPAGSLSSGGSAALLYTTLNVNGVAGKYVLLPTKLNGVSPALAMFNLINNEVTYSTSPDRQGGRTFITHLTSSPESDYIFATITSHESVGEDDFIYAWRRNSIAKEAPVQVQSIVDQFQYDSPNIKISPDGKYLFYYMVTNYVDKPGYTLAYINIAEQKEKSPSEWESIEVDLSHHNCTAPSGRGACSFGDLDFSPNSNVLYVRGLAIEETAQSTDLYSILAFSLNEGKWALDVPRSMINLGSDFGVGLANHLSIGPNVITAGSNDVTVASVQDLKDQGFTNWINFDGGTLRITDNLTISQPVMLMETGGIFNIEQDKLFAVNDTIAGPGKLTKTGVGTMAVNTIKTFTGGVDVNQGTFVVGDVPGTNAQVLGPVTVNNSGTLKGNGKVGALVVNSGGTVAPGNSPGVLTVTGDANFNAGSLYLVELTPEGQSDLLSIGGKATLDNGAKVQVSRSNANFTPGQHYTVLNATGGIEGMFGGVVDTMPLLNFQLRKEGNTIYIDLGRDQDTNLEVMADTANEKNVAKALESLGGGDAYNLVVGSENKEAARLALSLESGEVHASTQSALVQSSQLISAAVINRLRAASFPDGLGGPPVVAYAAHGATYMAPANTKDQAFWTQAFGGLGNTQSDGNAAKLDQSTVGLLFGMDRRIEGDWRIGWLGGYSYDSMDVDSRSSSSGVHSFHVGVYGGNQWGSWGVRTGVGYSLHNTTVKRSVAVGDFRDHLKSHYNGQALQFFGELGYQLDLGSQAALEPFVSLGYVNMRTPRFEEQGGGLSLRSSNSTMNTVFSTLGLHGSAPFRLDNLAATARGTLGWRHAYGAVTPSNNNAFVAGGDSFKVEGLPVASNVVVLEAGLDVVAKRDMTVGVSYAGQFGKDTQNHVAQMNLVWKF